MSNSTPFRAARIATALLFPALAATAHADAITDWNVKAGELIVEARLGTPPAIRVMAIAQTAANEAVTAVALKLPAAAAAPDPARQAAIDAAVAAAHRVTLAKLLPSLQPSIDAAYHAALARIVDGPAKSAGLAAGSDAAAAVLARRASDGTTSSEAYRPHTTAGAYVPTATPAASQWAQRRPWLLTSAAQFRPGPPPALASEAWARDYNEVRAIGARASSRRSAEQTEVARFWEYSLPPIYHGVVRSVAQLPGRDPLRNARLFAAVAQAMDDAMISVFEAKYHYNFWRPATAIRNGDIDGNDTTERDAAWSPLIEAPLHPEYPSAHAILAAAVATVLQADMADAKVPLLTTTSPTAKGAARSWTSLDDFVREVAEARIYEGIHYRTSTAVGVAMGRRIGELAVGTILKPEP